MIGSNPESFELTFTVASADIDAFGHVNNVVYVRWIQEAAEAHWRAIAPESAQANLFWVVLRHEIDYKQAAYLADELSVRTWVGAASFLKFERHTEILRAKDGSVLARALTVWCPIDIATGRPTKVGGEVRALFSQGA